MNAGDVQGLKTISNMIIRMVVIIKSEMRETDFIFWVKEKTIDQNTLCLRLFTKLSTFAYV
jgi:hypothetical protein